MKNSSPTDPGWIDVIDCGTSPGASGTGEETTVYTRSSAVPARAAQVAASANSPARSDRRRVSTSPLGSTRPDPASTVTRSGPVGAVPVLGPVLAFGSVPLLGPVPPAAPGASCAAVVIPSPLRRSA